MVTQYHLVSPTPASHPWWWLTGWAPHFPSTKEQDRVNYFRSSSGPPGITGIAAAILCTSLAITVATDSYVHWLFVAAGIAVGLWAAKIVDR